MAKILNENNYAYASERELKKRINTISLNKLEKQVENQDGLLEYVGAFLHYNNYRNKADLNATPKILDAMEKYEKWSQTGNNKFSKAKNILKQELEKHKNEIIEKDTLIKEINNYKINSKISYRKIFTQLKIKYSNGYNFFVKGEKNMINIERVRFIKKNLKTLLNTNI